MATALVARLLGLFGTFLGAALTTYTTRETSNRSERRAREEARHQEFRSAVIRFATNLLAYRLAEMDYWFAIHDGLKDMLPSTLFEYPAAELSGDNSAGLHGHHRATGYFALLWASCSDARSRVVWAAAAFVKACKKAGR